MWAVDAALGHWSGKLKSELQCMMVHRRTSLNDRKGSSMSGKGKIKRIQFEESSISMNFKREIQGASSETMMQTQTNMIAGCDIYKKKTAKL
ncbi:hypothetical protein D8674_006056 [Pyrus ussuriensis x Pyrus communis]|uniref:Uncharacterized protein n=1 Tax=Pyrus ussuriensis x Pyrus communis TaxID=2448454 RepID=A0A5N5FTB8_9ROSA|nr:hypothetical protein D8674_006056 [Pyrus ussuriensis x Pyrus communis]